jgi:Ca-activated chloride channel family protein
MHLYSPYTLLLLAALPVLAYAMLGRRRSASIRFPAAVQVRGCPASLRLRLRPLLPILRLACLALLIAALARPRGATVMSEISTEGVAIEVVVDRSGSMRTEMDYFGQKLNRLEAVKKVLSDFIKGDGKGFSGRSADLMGMISFARYADTVCPLVHSHGVLLSFLEKTGIVKLKSEDGTAIGDAIALAAARLKNAEAELEKTRRDLGLEGDDGGFRIISKVILLLTDGRNNAGEHSPMEAAKLAEEWGIRIYAVGIGSEGAFRTVQTMLGSFKMPVYDDVDEGLLTRISETTGGFYAKATDAKSLEKIVKRIDELEKTTVKSIRYAEYSENFRYLALPALAVLVLEMLAGCTVFRKIP